MELSNIKTICNLGTGTMGSGTAMLFALSGYQVRMFSRSDAGLQRGLANIQASLAILQQHNLVQAAEIPQVFARIKGFTTLAEAAQDADFVIESVAENLAIKQAVFQEMEKLCWQDTIFATNTSGLSPTAIAACLEHKQRFVVAHFWNPAHLMPPVEIVPGEHTSPETIDTTWKLIEKIGKKPVALHREALGFIGNRLQLALLREAFHIVEAGIASKEAVDAIVKYSLGRRLSTTGPFESTDLGGLDIFYNISSYLMADLENSGEIPSLLRQAVEQGRLGAKTGYGFYDWTPESLAKIQQTRASNLIEWLQKDLQENLPAK